MKVLLVASFSVLISNTALALECAVNERILEPVKIELDHDFELCAITPTGKGCHVLSELNFSAEQAAANVKTEMCGYKGSDLILEDGQLKGTAIICRGDTGLRAQNLPGFPCAPFKSKDGKFDLIMCTDLRGVVTLAFPAGSNGREPGMLLTNKMGSSKTISVNGVTCGDGRVRSHLKYKPFPSAPGTERSI